MTVSASAHAESDVPDCAVVIVTHNTKAAVCACLASLGAFPAGDEPPTRRLPIVVVDSGSTDDTAAAIAADFPQVRLLALANVGFGRAANAGIRATNTPNVVVANADVRFPAGTVARLAAELDADSSRGAVGPAVRDLAGRLQPTARRLPHPVAALVHGVFGRLWPRNPATRRYHAVDLDATRAGHPGRMPVAREADWLSGCALALRRHAFDAVGGFDPGYFLYMEDVDLALRLRRAGWRVWYQPAIEVTHIGGASTRRRPVRRALWHARSIDRFVHVHYLGPVTQVLRPLLWVGLAAWVALAVFTDLVGRLRGGRRRLDERDRVAP